MGCPLSKNNESDNQNKTSNTTGNQNEDEMTNRNQPSDQRIPLNARQRFNASKSWKGITGEMEMTGVLMFIK